MAKANKFSNPINAAAIILLDHETRQVLWVQRNPKLKFLGGFHGFPGGKEEESDRFTEVRNADGGNAENIACAVRELFEEIGILLVRNGDKLTNGQIVSLHDDLVSERSTFSEILRLWGLWIDAEDFNYAGFWTTPEFSPIRFKTHFFFASCPEKQTPYRAITELQEIEFIRPEKAIDLWTKSKILIAPPVLIAFREIAENAEQSGLIDANASSGNLRAQSADAKGEIDYIELNSRLICVPLRTKTLPPATHTNCFIVGSKKFLVIDAATKFEDEQQKLFALVDEMIESGGVCEAIIVSHLHRDHFGAEVSLKDHLAKKFGIEVPIAAHKITAESLKGKVEIVRFIDDKTIYVLENTNGKSFSLEALHTPGHARGHLCFYDQEFGFLLSSDNVLGNGTVVIAPPEGNMLQYFDSLERMKNLPNLNFLCGSHGAAVFDAKGKIEEYLRHRLEREEQVLTIARNTTHKKHEIAAQIYDGLEEKLMPLAVATVEAHLEKLRFEERIEP